MVELIGRMGLLAWPLLLCSLLTLYLIGERLLYFLRCPMSRRASVQAVAGALAEADLATARITAQADQGAFADGFRVMLAHVNDPRALRDDAVSLWLEGLRRRLLASLTWLQLIGAIAPLLGLLGTVIGMILAFSDISRQTGPVAPAQIADGLWQAMLTTATGLAIAIPALVSAHGFRIWADGRVQTLSSDLNRVSIALERGRSRFRRRAEDRSRAGDPTPAPPDPPVGIDDRRGDDAGRPGR